MMKKDLIDDNEIKHLMNGILLQAIKDWERLCSKEAKTIKKRGVCDENYLSYFGETFSTISCFLESEYGQNICDTIGFSSNKLIMILNGKREECKRKAMEAWREKNGY